MNILNSYFTHQPVRVNKFNKITILIEGFLKKMITFYITAKVLRNNKYFTFNTIKSHSRFVHSLSYTEAFERCGSLCPTGLEGVRYEPAHTKTIPYI